MSPISAIPQGADLSCPIPRYFSLSTSSGGPALSSNSSSLPPWRTPAACLEDPRGSPWEVSSPDLPLSLIIATCRVALQPRLAMKGCRKSVDCPFNNNHSLPLAPSQLSGSDETRTSRNVDGVGWDRLGVLIMVKRLLKRPTTFLVSPFQKHFLLLL